MFAAGDVIGWPSLASAAYDQGRCAAAHILGLKDTPHVEDVPTGIYTIPEISMVGKTEQQLTMEGKDYAVSPQPFWLSEFMHEFIRLELLNIPNLQKDKWEVDKLAN